MQKGLKAEYGKPANRSCRSIRAAVFFFLGFALISFWKENARGEDLLRMNPHDEIGYTVAIETID
jgi:hypothetical protein